MVKSRFFFFELGMDGVKFILRKILLWQLESEAEISHFFPNYSETNIG